MADALRVLFVDDSEHDVALATRELRRSGLDLVSTRVDSADDLRRALVDDTWDIVLADYVMPSFSGLEALAIVREQPRWVPFILVSGTIGEAVAVEALKAGADDYLLKDALARLGAAVERALRDASEREARVRAEAALRESEARFRSLVDSMDDVVVTLDRSLRLTGVYGRHARGGDERNPWSFGLESAETHEGALRRALEGERVLYEWTRASTEGSRHLQSSVSPLRDSTGTVVGVLSVTRDITEQKHLQVQLAAADRMVAVGMLAAGVAHEVNNPLTAVVSALEAVSEHTNRADPLATPVRDALDASHRIARVVRDLTLMSRAPDDVISTIDVHDVLDSSIRLAEYQIKHHARVVRRFGGAPRVRANASRLGQVFLNLLLNASQAVPESRTGTIEVHTRSSLTGEAVIEVRDDGVGMSSETLSRLFTPFFTTKPIGVGTGLGLSICQRIVATFGGRIEVESTLGSGSAFRVILPAVAPTRAVTPPPTERRFEVPRSRVALVDDDPQVLRVLTRLLAVHDVAGFASGQALLDHLSAGNEVDVVVCDLMMPGMTGIDVHAALSERYPRLAESMIVLTGGAFTAAGREFLASSHVTQLQKPVERATLVRAVARAVLGLREDG